MRGKTRKRQTKIAFNFYVNIHLCCVVSHLCPTPPSPTNHCEVTTPSFDHLSHPYPALWHPHPRAPHSPTITSPTSLPRSLFVFMKNFSNILSLIYSHGINSRLSKYYLNILFTLRLVFKLVENENLYVFCVYEKYVSTCTSLLYEC